MTFCTARWLRSSLATYYNQTEDEYALMTADPEVEVVEHSENENGTHDVTVERKDAYAYAKVEAVPPEEFGIGAQSTLHQGRRLLLPRGYPHPRRLDCRWLRPGSGQGAHHLFDHLGRHRGAGPSLPRYGEDWLRKVRRMTFCTARWLRSSLASLTRPCRGPWNFAPGPRDRHVRLGSLADKVTSPRHVRFTPNSGRRTTHQFRILVVRL
jgi:hypothetical protein